MVGTALTGRERDTLALTMWRVERRLGIALALLLLGILGIVVSVTANPVIQYAFGTDVAFVASMEGAACGSHLEWSTDSDRIAPGTRVTFVNDSTYWQIPVVIERQQNDGAFTAVAESPVLRGGESWNHTFWRGGTYRIMSADDTQRLAGLDTVISVE